MELCFFCLLNLEYAGMKSGMRRLGEVFHGVKISGLVPGESKQARLLSHRRWAVPYHYYVPLNNIIL